MSKLNLDKVNQMLRDKNGNVAVAAKSLNVTRQALYNFIKAHASSGDVLTEARETMKDNVESQLYNQALRGNTAAMIFFLKTQAKDRGYIERQEISGPEGKPIALEDVEKIRTQRWKQISSKLKTLEGKET